MGSLVADFLDVEEPAFGANIRVAHVLDPVDDGRADGQRDTVVIGFPHSPQGGDVVLRENVLCEI
jgi:hypothetical protein